jgi:hypothetical protein
MSCEYVKEHYGVPAEIGRRVLWKERGGIISEDRGHYIGVTFDDEKPGSVSNMHPTTEGLEYLGMGEVRRMTASQKRYQEFLNADWFNGTFSEWIGIT